LVPFDQLGELVSTAARLYHSMGFEQVGVRRGYYQAAVGREDAAVLRRLLLPEAK
jgi:ribosomal protein S18 acetylase RimI-like enzyme